MSIIYKLSNNIINSTKPYVKNKSDDDFEIAKYGLSIFFMELYKLPILFGLAYYLGIFEYCFFAYILFGIIRSQANGIHMRNGRGCLFYSCIAFFSIVYISKLLALHWIFRIIVSLLVMYFIYKYAPADTEDRPILNSQTRKRNKKMSIIISIIYLSLSLIFSNKIISNLFLLILVLECILIHPTTYKIFNRRYNNYEHFE